MVVFLFLIFFSLHFPRIAIAKVVTLNPAFDTTVVSSLPQNNYGTNDRLTVGKNYKDFPPNGRVFQTLVKFDLSQIPKNSTINSATLRLYQVGEDQCQEACAWEKSSFSIYLYLTDENWSENSVTWSNQPSYSFYEMPLTGTIGKESGYKNWDVEIFVKKWVSQTSLNYGFLLRAPGLDITGPDCAAEFYSRESSLSKPQLAVDYTPPLSIPPKIQPKILDLVAPKISNIQVTWNIDTAQVSWVTNEASDSFLDYGETATYGQTLGKSESVTEHKIDIPGLKYDTLYHYHVKSKDAKGNLATSGDATFTTPKEPTVEAEVVDQTPPLESEETAETAPETTETSPATVDAEAGEGAKKEAGTSMSALSSPTGFFGLSLGALLLIGGGFSIFLVLIVLVIVLLATRKPKEIEKSAPSSKAEDIKEAEK